MIIKVSVKPSAKKEMIERISGDEYRISVKEKAENGKANRKVISLLAKEFNVSYRDISIKNPASRKKIVSIAVK